MRKFYDALSDIHAIRGQIARGTEFRGYGPASIAATGVLALGIAAIEAWRFAAASIGMAVFLETWAAAAAVSVVFTGIETIVRARRVHRGFAQEMIQSAAEQFVPVVMAILRAESLTELPVIGRLLANDPSNRPGTVVPDDVLAAARESSSTETTAP